MVSHWTALRRCALVSLVALASACAAFNGAPAPIPADQVLASRPDHSETMSAELRTPVGDQLRGYLSDE
jgi:hypothetical protein